MKGFNPGQICQNFSLVRIGSGFQGAMGSFEQSFESSGFATASLFSIFRGASMGVLASRLGMVVAVGDCCRGEVGPVGGFAAALDGVVEAFDDSLDAGGEAV